MWEVVNRKTKSSYILSIVFLLIIVFSTIWLNQYNNYLESDINEIKSGIETRNQGIKKIEGDKNIQIFSLLERNKKIIESYKKMNKITTYINHMNVIAWKYKLNFKWFWFSKGIISTNVTITSDDEGIAYQKTKDFIEKYRNDNKSLFELDFISSIQGMDTIKFNTKFKIK